MTSIWIQGPSIAFSVNNMWGFPGLNLLAHAVHINDLNEHLSYCNASLYADDTALYTTGETQVKIISTKSYNWQQYVNGWRRIITLNTEKNKYVIFGTKQKLKQKPDFNLTVGNKHIEWLNTMKCLRVQMNDHLSFEDQVNKIHAKATTKLGILRKST